MEFYLKCIRSFKKIYSKMSYGKWRPFCLGLNVLTHCFLTHYRKWFLAVKLLSWENHRTSLARSQHSFRYWLGARVSMHFTPITSQISIAWCSRGNKGVHLKPMFITVRVFSTYFPSYFSPAHRLSCQASSFMSREQNGIHRHIMWTHVSLWKRTVIVGLDLSLTCSFANMCLR